MRCFRLASLCLAVAGGLLLKAGDRQAPAQEPGSRAVVAASFRTGDLELFRVDIQTGDARNLTRAPRSSERYPACSPDGRFITFNSNRDGTYNLYIMRQDGSDLRPLTHERPGVEAGMQTWTRDGRWIYFGLFGKEPPRMCRIHPDGSGFAVVGQGIDPAVSPDGSRIAFARVLADGHHLFVMDSETALARQLTTEGNPWGGLHPVWTPDGRGVIHAGRVGNGLELFSQSPDSGERRQLTRLGGAATSPRVSSDGRFVSFRFCDEVYWRDGATSSRTYREHKADKRPVWIMEIDGANPHVIEPLHYQTTIDGSPAPFLP